LSTSAGSENMFFFLLARAIKERDTLGLAFNGKLLARE
jgi:hypothetical protein